MEGLEQLIFSAFHWGPRANPRNTRKGCTLGLPYLQSSHTAGIQMPLLDSEEELLKEIAMIWNWPGINLVPE